jgi:hypothetical protein
MSKMSGKPARRNIKRAPRHFQRQTRWHLELTLGSWLPRFPDKWSRYPCFGNPRYRNLAQVFAVIFSRAITLLHGELLSQSSSSDLASDLRAYVGGRRNSKRESELLRGLHGLPQQERGALLLPLLELKTGAVFALVDRAQLSRADYLEVLKRGLAEAKGESIRYWMDATVPHIGWRKTFSLLRQSMATNPCVGAMALYFVPWVCRGKGQLSGSLPTRELALEWCA